MRRGWVVEALEAASAAGAVCLMAWYTIARASEFHERVAQVDAGWVGLITIVIVLVAGSLLAFAFNRAEDAVREWRRGTHPTPEADD